MRTYLVAFIDVICCMFMIVLMMVNPVQDPQNALPPPGNLFVNTTWSGVAGDVDTWMYAPGMADPLGYDDKDSPVCNLVKDDLGLDFKPGESNFENVFCRQTPDGEYIINVHAFGIKTTPVEVKVEVAMFANGKTTVLFEENVVLRNNKEELTAIRFSLKDGKVVEGSVHHVFVSLYNVGQK